MAVPRGRAVILQANELPTVVGDYWDHTKLWTTLATATPEVLEAVSPGDVLVVVGAPQGVVLSERLASERHARAVFCLGGQHAGLRCVDPSVIPMEVFHDELREALHEQVERDRVVLAARMTSVGALADGVVHDVNNPSAYITANLDLMQHMWREMREAGTMLDDYEAQEFTDMLQECLEGIEAITSIMRDYRRFSSLEDGPDEVVVIGDVVAHALRLLAPLLRHRASIEEHITAIGDLEIRGRYSEVLHMIVSVLDNAGRALPRGSAADHVINISGEARERVVVVHIDDDGPGLSKDAESWLTPWTSTRGRLGLGLSAADALARRYGGELRLSPSSRGGLRVSLSLMRDRRHDDAQAKPAEAAKPRVLLVDDEPLLRRAFRRMLNRDAQVLLAEGGREAIALLEQGVAVDAVVCDLQMPGCDGTEVYRWIAARRADLIDRFYVLTGGVFEPEHLEFLRDTGVRTLDKPIDWEMLRHLVEGLQRA